MLGRDSFDITMHRRLTWRHVESRSASKVRSDAILRSKAKIRELDSPSTVLDKNVLRLEITVEHSIGMAVADGIHDLEEDMLGLCILSQIITLFGDLGEQVAFWAILKDDKSAIIRFEDLLHGHNVGMLAGLVMQPDLTVLEAPLPRVDTNPVQGLHGILVVGLEVASPVDGPVRADSKDIGQLDLVVAVRKNQSYPIVWVA